MSTLTQFASGGVKQIITGYVKAAAPTNSATPGGTGSEDYHYYDITHGGTLDPAKCVVTFDGGSHYISYSPYSSPPGSSTAFVTRIATARLTSSTNLRLATAYETAIGASLNYYYFTGRFTIVEYY